MAFEFDTKTLFAGLGASTVSATNAAVEGMHDATDDLLFRSREEAPLDKGTLRETSGKNVEVTPTKITGEVYFSATETGKAGDRVNYALIVHEMAAFKNPTTPGTKPKYLEDPLTQHANEYKRLIADAIRKGLT
ncbi:HK97 gp10 family phage protein [Paenibacillus tundrae]|uniref:HK97 gp10 family phage protein n=1 Tax=Paenibacillus tundrae TaxID=528187 RepID=A0ABT9W695_9BACL|nr:HK97 gp10 family phage protein [Paenibacillus tundrae]MDQ0168774.1 hypothetical protein [Paenibacillus tundrae]